MRNRLVVLGLALVLGAVVASGCALPVPGAAPGVAAKLMSTDWTLVLLAGGRDKDLPWFEFAELVQQRVRNLILFGEAAGKIAKAVGDMNMTICKDLKDAVQTAAGVIQPGDVVLLSPGGTSFDEFIDFEERGECFRELVMQL